MMPSLRRSRPAAATAGASGPAPGAVLHAALFTAALLAAAVLLSACAGTKPATTSPAAAQGGRPPTAGEVRLVLSRDFGATVLRDLVVPARDKLDVLRLLAENADVDTGYGGRFVDGIDGLKSSFGATSTADAADWFYWVDGVMADVGADSWQLRGGETVWWDYHRWADAMFVPQALAAFPRPYDQAVLPVAAAQDVPGLAEWAAANGLRLAPRKGLEAQPRGGLVLATAAQAAATPWLTALLGADASGIALVAPRRDALTVLSASGRPAGEADGVAVPAPDAAAPERPFLIVLGRTPNDLRECLSHVKPQEVTAKVGLAVVDGRVVGLPVAAK